MSNYAGFLSNFNIDVIAKRSKENSNADYLYRLPIIKKGNCGEKGSDALDNFITRQIKQLA